MATTMDTDTERLLPNGEDGSDNEPLLQVEEDEENASILEEATPAHEFRQAQRSEVVLIFLAAVGSTIAWTAVLSNLVYYSMMLGLDSYLYLNLVVYGPLLPISILQALYDSDFDRKYASLSTFTFRGGVGYGVTLLATIAVPLCSHNLLLLSLTTLLLGTASGVLHGTLKQMAAFIYPNCGRLPASVASGMQASAVLVLFVTLTTGFGHCADESKLYMFYGVVFILELICGTAFLVLVFCSKEVRSSMYRRDSSMIDAAGSDTPLLGGERATDETAESVAEASSSRELSYPELWRRTWPICAALMITVGSSMSVASWFNRVQSEDPLRTSLPQILFYTRLFADLLGRPATLIGCPASRCTATTSNRTVAVRVSALTRAFGFVPIFFLYVTTDRIPRNDIVVIACVALFAFTSGYLATSCYQLAPSMLNEEEKATSCSKQASLINVCFSLAVLLGLVVSFSLKGV